MKKEMSYRAVYRRHDGITQSLDFYAESFALARDHARHCESSDVGSLVRVARVDPDAIDQPGEYVRR